MRPAIVRLAFQRAPLDQVQAGAGAGAAAAAAGGEGGGAAGGGELSVRCRVVLRLESCFEAGGAAGAAAADEEEEEEEEEGPNERMLKALEVTARVRLVQGLWKEPCEGTGGPVEVEVVLRGKKPSNWLVLEGAREMWAAGGGSVYVQVDPVHVGYVQEGAAEGKEPIAVPEVLPVCTGPVCCRAPAAPEPEPETQHKEEAEREEGQTRRSAFRDLLLAPAVGTPLLHSFRSIPLDAADGQQNPLLVKEEYGAHIGAHVWDSGIVTARAVTAWHRICTPFREWLAARPNAIEIASGCGIGALALARICSAVLATDLTPLLPLLRENCAMAASSTTVLDIQLFDIMASDPEELYRWLQDHEPSQAERDAESRAQETTTADSSQRLGLFAVADILYAEALHEPLAELLRAVVMHCRGACLVLLAQKLRGTATLERAQSLPFFPAARNAGLEVHLVGVDSSVALYAVCADLSLSGSSSGGGIECVCPDAATVRELCATLCQIGIP